MHLGIHLRMKADFHVHTSFSFDAVSSPRKIVSTAISRGIGILAITDHESIEGAQEAVRIANGRILVIVGQEIHSTSGDIIGIFLKKRIDESDPVKVLDEIHDQGGLSILPHPLTHHAYSNVDIAKRLNGIEAANWRYRLGIRKVVEDDQRFHTAVQDYKLAVIGSSDSHRARELGRCYTEIEANSEEGVRRAILERRTFPNVNAPGQITEAFESALSAVYKFLDPLPEKQAAKYRDALLKNSKE